MRVSSSMTPFASGTLKSTRTKTRLPLRSRSVIESFIARLKPRVPAPLEALRHELAQQIDAAVRVAPLVVVPREDLDEVAIHHLRVRHVDDGGVRIAFEVDRDELLGRARQDVLQRSIRRLLQR